MKIIKLILIFILFSSSPHFGFLIIKSNGYKIKYNFPNDHFAHPNIQTEWWYYTGHLFTSTGERYGYELTFFKVEWPRYRITAPPNWKAKPLYFAHFAVTDKNKKLFRYAEKSNRPIGSIAGADTTKFHIWNDGWSVKRVGKWYFLEAKSKNFAIKLRLLSQKRPVVHGKQGVSHKGTEKGNFSYYYSLTRLQTRGKIIIGGKELDCVGTSWMDHEWMNNRRFANGANSFRWDWFSLQFDDNVEIMFYTLRDNHQKIRAVSSGTLVFPDGTSKHLSLSDISIKILNYWQSPDTQGVYPIKWKLTIPKRQIELVITPYQKNQELNTKQSTGVIYWEGAVSIVGKRNNKSISGEGYVEMTGYAKIH